MAHLADVTQLIQLAKEDGEDLLVDLVLTTLRVLGEKVAANHRVRCVSARYEVPDFGGVMIAFEPAYPRQICPAPIAALDPDSDWAIGEDYGTATTLPNWLKSFGGVVPHEGWLVAETSRGLAIQRDDSSDFLEEGSPFDTDAEAVEHVTRRAAEGSVMHVAALQLVALPMPNAHVAKFQAQTWQRDYAIDVDAEGNTAWSVDPAELDGCDEHFDDLRTSRLAPDWVRDWTGPFTITVDDCLTQTELAAQSDVREGR